MAASSSCSVKESITWGLIEIIQKLSTGHLQCHEADYLYYKLERVETILCQYVQLADIEDRVFGCISEVKYMMKNPTVFSARRYLMEIEDGQAIV